MICSVSKYFHELLQKSDNLCAEFLFYSQLSRNLHHPPCIFGASGKPRDRVPLPQIKSGEKWLDKKKDSGEQAACEYPPELAHLKKFVQVSEATGFCVDTENAAV